MLLLHRDPFTKGSIFKDAVWSREHHSGTIRKLIVSATLDNAGPFVAQHERRFCHWQVSGENGVIERGDSGGSHPHQDASIRHCGLGDVRRFQILIAAERLCHNRAHLLIYIRPLRRRQLDPGFDSQADDGIELRILMTLDGSFFRATKAKKSVLVSPSPTLQAVRKKLL